MRKSVAIICKYKWVGISTSVLNTIVFFQSKGYIIDLYLEKPDLNNFPLPDYQNTNVNVIITNINKKQIIEDIIFRIKYFKKTNYSWIICFDYGALIRGGISTLFTNSKLVYHSLEFFELSHFKTTSLRSKIFNHFAKFLEILFSFRAKYIFAQDEYRINFLKTDLHQKMSKFRVIYNSPYQRITYSKSNYFRHIFNIPDHVMIVLCIGSIVKEHYISELIESLHMWNDKFTLVIHGVYFEKSIKDKIELVKSNFPNKIYLSEKFFDHDSKHIPYTSCDIGFVGFLPLTNNLKYAAGSAGKLFDMMLYAKPILAYRTPGMKELIDENNIGITFDKPENINQCLLDISKNYTAYCSNCKEMFEYYSFKNQYENVFKEILQ